MGTTARKFRISHSLAWHHKLRHHGHHFVLPVYLRMDLRKEEVLENTRFSRTLWRRRWDSNPRALADNLISSQARYDHFDTSPWMNMRFSRILYMISNPDPSATWVHLRVLLAGKRRCTHYAIFFLRMQVPARPENFLCPGQKAAGRIDW